jgi:phospholipid/cholesterol/gamma-HCH transport system substrate-binding protein
VLRGQHSELVEMLTALDKLGVVGTRVVEEIKDDLVAELRHLEPILRNVANAGRDQSAAPNCPGCDTLVPGLVAAAGYPFPVDAGDTIHGDFANVVFKMQIKLTPISEGGLLPTTLQDLERLCRSTPLAPICSPAGDAIEQICTLLGSLPLCAQTGNAAAAGGTQPGTVPGTTPPIPDILKPPAQPDAGGGGSGGTFMDRLFGGLLGGGSG